MVAHNWHNECNTATKRQQTYVLANKRHGVGAHVTICKNILFFGVEAAVQRTHANKVTRAFEKCERKHMLSSDDVTYMRKAPVFTAPDAQCASSRPLITEI